MAGISPIETAARKERLLEELPKHGWSIIKAGIAAGWSPAYAKTTLQRVIERDASLCKRIVEKRQSLDATTGDRREKALRKIDAALEQPGLRPMELARLVEVQGKMCGWLSETRILETAPRQAELDAGQRELAEYLARARFSTLLPGTEIVSTQDGSAAGEEPGIDVAQQSTPY
jgi:hypothetical protein